MLVLNNREKVLIGIIIILVILLVSCSNSFDPYGVYVADSSFLEEAGLNNMTLYIGNEISNGLFSTTYTGYLYIDNDDGAIEDQKIELTLSKKCSGKYNLQIDNVESWDDSMILYYCQDKGTITLYKDDIVYAELYKDNILTDYSKSDES